MKTHRAASTRTISLAVAAGTFATALCIAWFLWPSTDPYEPLQKTFDAESVKLTRTVIVPTLDTPIPEDKSAIWCSSFQLAWNRLRNDVIHEAIVLKGAETTAQRLNNAKASDKDMAPNSFYAAAGWARDGIVDRVRKDMARKFPSVAIMDLAVPADGALAYGYLSAAIKYKHKYDDGHGRLRFPVGDGTRRPVGCFGFLEHGQNARVLRGQAEILFSSLPGDKAPEFAVELCRGSADQIVLACIPQKQSLAEALAYAHEKIASYPADDSLHTFDPTNSLLAPNMSWRIVHRFKELEGKHFQNGDLQSATLDAALQVIDLTMDRSGTELKSESNVRAKGVPPMGKQGFFFDEPFLLYLQKRGAEHPFFAMWAANAELLQ